MSTRKQDKVAKKTTVYLSNGRYKTTELFESHGGHDWLQIVSYYNKNGELDSKDDLPCVIYSTDTEKCSVEKWYRNDLLHRDDFLKPSIIWYNIGGEGKHNYNHYQYGKDTTNEAVKLLKRKNIIEGWKQK